ncbi:hypothetical protein IP84_16935 [beta proteobacterium AAP99]|nr:hypothetical protein IP84_16935 [beta proteobacterium AAP99]
MNCKPGDLAVVVRTIATPELLGRIVRVDRLAQPGDVSKDGRCFFASSPVLAWFVCADGAELPTRDIFTGELFWVSERPVRDDCLRSIRDSDGEDEILRLIGKPEKVTA